MQIAVKGELVYVRESLVRELIDEAKTWHWIPWIPIRTEITDNIMTKVECFDPNSAESFPESIFTRKHNYQVKILFNNI